MEITANAVYDRKSVQTISRLTLSHKIAPRTYMIRVTLAVLLLTAAVVCGDLWRGASLFLWFLVGFGWCALIVLSVIYFLLPQRRYRAMQNRTDLNNTYLFKDREFQICPTDPELGTGERINYSRLLMVYETADYLFLFLKNSQGYIVDRKTIQNGTMEDIRRAIQPKLAEGKYVICSY